MRKQFCKFLIAAGLARRSRWNASQIRAGDRFPDRDKLDDLVHGLTDEPDGGHLRFGGYLRTYPVLTKVSFTLPQENAEGNESYERTQYASPQPGSSGIRDIVVQVDPQATFAQ